MRIGPETDLRLMGYVDCDEQHPFGPSMVVKSGHLDAKGEHSARFERPAGR